MSSIIERYHTDKIGFNENHNHFVFRTFTSTFINQILMLFIADHDHVMMF